VLRYDLVCGRELGSLLASADAASGRYSVEGGGHGGRGEREKVSGGLTCMAAGGVGTGSLVAAAGEGGDVFLWDARAGPRSGSGRGGGCAPAMTVHVSGAARILSLSLSGSGGGGGGTSAPTNLALVASNGARVFDLRMPDRPLRLTSRESGQR